MQGQRQLKKMTPKILATFSGTTAKSAQVNFVVSEKDITNREQRRSYAKAIKKGHGA